MNFDKDLYNLEDDKTATFLEHPPKETRNIILFYVENALQGIFYSYIQLQSKFKRPQEELETLFKSNEDYLKEFKLPLPDAKAENDLTELQLRVLHKITSAFDNRQLTTLLKELDVDLAQHEQWLNQEAYRRVYTNLIRNKSQSAQGEILRRVTTQATKGDRHATNTFLDLYKTNSQVSSIDKVLEVLQRVLTQDQLTQVLRELEPPKN